VRHQRQSAVVPTTDEQRRGRDLVVEKTCGMCHAIAGTMAQGRRAPDLTHVASRLTLGAGIVANNDDTRTDWIANPQKIKPGVNMPPYALPREDLAAISAYLGTLR